MVRRAIVKVSGRLILLLVGDSIKHEGLSLGDNRTGMEIIQAYHFMETACKKLEILVGLASYCQYFPGEVEAALFWQEQAMTGVGY